MKACWEKRSAALGERAPASRGGRWLLRLQGEQPADVAALCAVPPWHGWDAGEQRRLALAVALLHHRPQLDRELRGEVLAPLASLAGESLFDAVCRAEVDSRSEAGGLPGAAVLNADGAALIAAGDPYGAALTRTAAALMIEAEA